MWYRFVAGYWCSRTVYQFHLQGKPTTNPCCITSKKTKAWTTLQKPEILHNGKPCALQVDELVDTGSAQVLCLISSGRGDWWKETFVLVYVWYCYGIGYYHKFVMTILCRYVYWWRSFNEWFFYGLVTLTGKQSAKIISAFCIVRWQSKNGKLYKRQAIERTLIFKIMW